MMIVDHEFTRVAELQVSFHIFIEAFHGAVVGILTLGTLHHDTADLIVVNAASFTAIDSKSLRNHIAPHSEMICSSPSRQRNRL